MSTSIIEKLIMEKYEPIAIIGVALRFPGSANTLHEFEKLLQNGVDGITEIPKSRWDNSKFYSNKKDDKGKIKTHSGGYIDNFDFFDPNFFSISPKEAQYIDPQQRIMLELAWESLESANINPTEIIGTNGGVFIGVSTTDFIKEITLLRDDQINGYMGTGSSNSAIPGRISYFLGLNGPSMVIDTACSSSLVALHVACNALRNNETNFALCGGVNVIHNPSNHISFSSANMLAMDGRCKTFDESADGYGRSEGAAMLVLKRLSDAKKDNHSILAVVRGTAVMQDGQSSALLVPNGRAQELVMNKAIENALMKPTDISYVEAHGTGTPLGDPIEISAISNVFDDKRNEHDKLTVSTVKTNIGHTEGTAGLAGVIKIILQIKNKTFFRHLHFNHPSKHIDWTTVPVQIPKEKQDWGVSRRCALVNSFGFAGTIASAVIEEYHNDEASVGNKDAGNFVQVLTISAKSKNSLKALISQYRSLISHTHLDLKQVCHNTNYARVHFKYRVATNLVSKSDIDQYLSQQYEKISEETHSFEAQKECAFLFAGQGAQYFGMGKDLYESSVVFKKYIDICDHLFSKYIKRSIKDIIFIDNDNTVDATEFTQPALFSMEYALAMMWMSFGLIPKILIGHSIGEIVAATVSGLFDLDDAIRLVAARSKWMGSVSTPGGMIAINLSVDEIMPYIANLLDLSIAAVNTKNQTVISGDIDQIHRLEKTLTSHSIQFKNINVSHAFHSKLMNEILSHFKNEISNIKFNKPAIPFVSNVTGKIAEPEEVMSIDYWANHIVKPVQFYAGVKAVYEFGTRVFVDISTTSSTVKMAKNCLNGHKECHFLSSIDKGVRNTETISDAIAKLYCLGFDLNWSSIINKEWVKPVDLPIYQFDRKKYWLESSLKGSSHASSHHVLLGNMIHSDKKQWMFQSEISPKNPGYLADHVVKGQIVFPAVGFLEVIIALQDVVFGSHNLSIEDLKISEPLFLHNTHSVKLLTSLRERTADGYEFLIYSENEKGNKRHASGKLRDCNIDNLDGFITDDMPDFGTKSDILINGNELYDVLLKKGLELGQSFVNVLNVRIYDEMYASANIKAYSSLYGEYLNPAVADSVLHAIEPIVSSFDDSSTYLPVGIEKFIFLKRPKGHLISKVSVKKMGAESHFDYLADLCLEDSYGTVFLAKNLQIKAISQLGKSEGSYLNVLYETRWIPQKYAHGHNSSSINNVVILGDKDISGLNFVHSMVDLERYLKNQPNCAYVVFVWSNKTSNDISNLEEILKNNYTNILSTIRLINEKYSDRNISLCFVTNHAQLLSMDSVHEVSDENLIQSTLWGFCNVLNQEFPRFNSRIFDIEYPDDKNSYDKIIDEISSEDTHLETQVAYRDNLRFVKRLVDIDVEDNNFEFIISEYGDFANIKKNYIPTKRPKFDEVLIRVCAVGLNFKDVLNASGLLRQYYEIPLGFECSGVILEAGSGSGFKEGDEVVASYSGCMKKYLVVSSKYVALKPKNINLYQAAGLPTAYITSYHALHNLAQIKSSDSILIHSAAGGVGHAAIELARRAKARLYATSHESKWTYLENYGIAHPMSSRDSVFADNIMELTNHDGVDVVLNSLSADLIPAGINVLSKAGRFINLTKINNIDESDAIKLRSDISYYNFDLGLMDDTQINTKEILTEITKLIELGEIKPIPISLYSTDTMTNAFQELASGQSRGKIVISFIEEGYQNSRTAIHIKPQSTYIITGGYGAIGVETAKWLAASGAGKIALLGRSQPSNASMISLHKLIPQEKLIFLTADVSNEEQMRKIIISLDNSAYPIDGIIHAAGELDDSLLTSVQYASFEKVFKSKVLGSYILHKLSPEIKNLGFLISYSSIASFAGTAGQSNYSAANAYIDTLMSYREKLGKRSLAVNWGPWSEIGMASKLNLSVVKHIEEKGIFSIKPVQAMNTLSKYLNISSSQLVVGEFDWSKYYQKLPVKSAFYHKIINNAEDSKFESLSHTHILELADEAQYNYISNHIRDILKEIMLFSDLEEIDPYSKFSELGVDSLTSVEFQVSIEKLFNMKLIASFLHMYPSIPDLVKHIIDQIMEINTERRNRVNENTEEQFELS